MYRGLFRMWQNQLILYSCGMRLLVCRFSWAVICSSNNLLRVACKPLPTATFYFFALEGFTHIAKGVEEI
jgi:hypothetical protein